MSDNIIITERPRLTDTQRAWANAFLRVLGGKGQVEADHAQRPLVRTGHFIKVDHIQPELAGSMGAQFDVAVARDQLQGKGEDVSRGNSKDRGYKAAVVKIIDKLIDSVDTALAQNQSVTPETMPKLAALRSALLDAHIRYLRKSQDDIANPNAEELALRQQREAKAAAIEGRVEALDRMMALSQLDELGRVNAAAALSPREQAKMMVENPAIFQAVVAAKPVPDSLVSLLEHGDRGDIEGQTQVVMEALAEDADYLDALCERAFAAELAEVQVGDNTFLRGNTTATKLTKARSLVGDGKVHVDGVVAMGREMLEQLDDPRLELDPDRYDPELGAAEIARRSEAAGRQLAGMVQGLLQGIMRAPVPREISSVCGMIATAARAAGRDDRNVAILVGGHVFLRLLCPALTAMPNLDQAQRRVMVLVTKLLQNISNGISGAAAKEAFMLPVSQALADQIDPLHDWFLHIADEAVLNSGMPTNPNEWAELTTLLTRDDYDMRCFAAPSEDDPLGVAPAQPGSRIGKLVTAALFQHQPPQDVRLPTPIGAGHMKMVARERRAVLNAMLARVQALTPR